MNPSLHTAGELAIIAAKDPAFSYIFSFVNLTTFQTTIEVRPGRDESAIIFITNADYLIKNSSCIEYYKNRTLTDAICIPALLHFEKAFWRAAAGSTLLLYNGKGRTRFIGMICS